MPAIMPASDPRPLSDSEARQKAYYNEIAATYDQHYGSDEGLAYRTTVFDRVMAGQDMSGWNALDAMCGGGQNSVYFAERGCQVTGVDISEGQCDFYRQRFPDSEVYCRSALDTGLDDESFDLVFTDSLHHLPPHVNRGVAEFHRLLRPGGLFLAWEPSARSVFDYARKLWYRLDPTYFEDNEQAIDVDQLVDDNRHLFDLRDVVFGGNVAYASVALSMAMRIPLRLVDLYARPMQWVENVITPLQSRHTALWAVILLQKR